MKRDVTNRNTDKLMCRLIERFCAPKEFAARCRKCFKPIPVLPVKDAFCADCRRDEATANCSPHEPQDEKTRLVPFSEPMPETRDTCAACGKAIPALPAEDALCVKCRYDASAKSDTIVSDYDNELLAVVQPEPPSTLAEFFFIIESLGHSIPEAIRLKAVPELELLLDDLGDRHSAESAVILTRLFSMMIYDATPLQVGQRVIVMAHKMGLTGSKTHRELAQLLNVSPGRVTQILQAIPSNLQSLCRLKRRQN